MKKIKIGNREFKQIENAEELPIKRYTLLKQYVIYKQTGVNTPDLINTITSFVRGFDNESKSDMLISLHNYITGLNQIKDNYDIDQMIFSLITLLPDEKINDISEEKIKDKIDVFSELGLKQGIVEECVANFMMNSQTLLISSLKMNLNEAKELVG